MAASGNNNDAIGPDTFALWRVGGQRIPSTIDSIQVIDAYTTRVTISSSVNTSLEDDKDLVLATYNQGPQDMVGNQMTKGTQISYIERTLPQPVDDFMAPAVAVITEPGPITDSGTQVLTWTVEITDQG